MKLSNFAAVLLAILLLSSILPAQSNSISSPNGLLQLMFSVVNDGPQKGQLLYDLTYRGKPVLVHSTLGMDIRGEQPLGTNVQIVSSTPPSKVDETYTIPAGKSNPVRNFYNTFSVELLEPGTYGRRFSVEARAYDDGVAFRYVIPDTDGSNSLYIANERTQFQFSKDATTYPLILVSYRSSWEDSYHTLPVGSIHPDWLVGLPLLAEVPGAAWLAITEADIDNYAGMYLQSVEGDGNERILKARLSPRLDVPGVSVIGPTPLHTPWRAIMVADNPGRLIESNMVINLNPPCALADTSWIKPGKAAWDWWSGSYAEGVDKPGMNTATMKHYIDFASKAHFEYMMIDAFWAAHTDGPDASGADLTQTQPNINMPEILDFARSKNVRVWLWAHWADLATQMDQAFPLFEKWGVVGVKIDQLDRDDQWMMDFYRTTVKKAAEHHLMLDFHGVFKPFGMNRTYPNLMTQEGVMGLEYNKWSLRVTPDHNVMLAFTRMLAGPLDYTPGGFRNTRRDQFEARELLPEVLGTRAHQTALFVVFESPFEMVADYPEAYAGQKELAFISAVPTSWDETRVLNARVGDYVTIARRHGTEWYIGSIAGWHGADLEIPLSVLGSGQYVAEIYSDAADAAENPTHSTLESELVSQSTVLKAKLVSGGGQAIRIRPATAEDAPAKKH
ncbi:MAG: glycoside hydrolase family 97 protein [Terriglobales bacterium]